MPKRKRSQVKKPTCECNVHYNGELVDHITSRQNDEAKLMLNKALKNLSSNCLGELLHHAVAANNEDITELLISSGCPVDCVGQGKKTTLMMAAERNLKKITKILLEAGANINIVDAMGEDSLDKAVHSECYDLEPVEAILLRAKAEAPSNEALIEKLLAAKCPLPHAVLLRDADLLKDLLRRKRRFNVNSRNRLKRTALHYAVLTNEIGLAKLLIDNKANVDALDYCNACPLLYAVDKFNYTMVQLLLEHNADPYPDVTYFNELPLFAALIAGDRNDDERARECLEILLQHGAFPDDVHGFVSSAYEYRNVSQSSRLNTLVAHQAMIDALGTGSRKKKHHVSTFPELQQYYTDCQKVLKIKVAGNASILDLIGGYSEEMMRLCVRRNKTLASEVEQLCELKPELKKLHSYYVQRMMKNIGEAATRAIELENKAILMMCRLFHCSYNEIYIFARGVVDYLSDDDIERLYQV